MTPIVCSLWHFMLHRANTKGANLFALRLVLGQKLLNPHPIHPPFVSRHEPKTRKINKCPLLDMLSHHRLNHPSPLPHLQAVADQQAPTFYFAPPPFQSITKREDRVYLQTLMNGQTHTGMENGRLHHFLRLSVPFTTTFLRGI